MIGVDDALVFGKAGISLIPGIVEVVKRLRKTDPDPTLQRVIDQLVTDTREQCKRLSDETRALEVSLQELGGAKDKRLSDLYKELHTLNFPRKSALNKHKNALKNIHAALSSSVDDIVSVLICAGKVNDLESASILTQEIRRGLDGLVSGGSERTIGEILEIYRQTIDRWVQDLR